VRAGSSHDGTRRSQSDRASVAEWIDFHTEKSRLSVQFSDLTFEPGEILGQRGVVRRLRLEPCDDVQAILERGQRVVTCAPLHLDRRHFPVAQREGALRLGISGVGLGEAVSYGEAVAVGSLRPR
jgi:hypothetical protein